MPMAGWGVDVKRWPAILFVGFVTMATSLGISLPAGAIETTDEIVVVGGTGVVSDALFEHLGTCSTGGVARVAGQDRYATAAAVAAHWESAETVFLATGLAFPDAVTGGPIAGLNEAPMLLTHPDWLPAPTHDALTRLQPRRIVLLGGTGAIGTGVESALRGQYEEVIRLAGPDRYATAAAVATWHFTEGTDTVYVATGLGYHDALLAGPAAVRDNAALLLVSQSDVPGATRSALAALSPERIVVVGGTGVVSPAVADLLGAYAPVERIAGASLEDTAAAVAETSPGSGVFVATRDGFADALAVIPLSNGAPTVFVSSSLDSVTAGVIENRSGQECAAWSPPYPAVGSGQRIIYSNSGQQVWLVNADDTLQDTYLVSGRQGVPHPGTYVVFSKSVTAWAGHDGITMAHMVRFVPPWGSGNRLAIGFHAIPRDSSGTPLQTEAELGTYQSAGCVRQSDEKAAALYQWAPIGTPVIVLP